MAISQSIQPIQLIHGIPRQSGSPAPRVFADGRSIKGASRAVGQIEKDNQGDSW